MNRLPALSTLAPRLKTLSRKTRRMYLNDFSVLNPTIWANEAILRLLPNMVLANLVQRDTSSAVAKFGDIVNAFVPATFEMNRKGQLCDNVVVQDASGSRVQVPLDQWPQVSFLICDGEEDRNQLDLINTLLVPSVQALALGADRILGSQVMQFIKTKNVAGHLNNVDSTNIRAYVLELREKLNRNNVPVAGRNLILTPGTETEALQVDAFTFANEVGDNGEALRNAILGRKYGFDIYMTQTEPEVNVGQPTLGVIAINGAVAAGATSAVIDGAGIGTAGASLKVGQWMAVAGDDTPQQLTAVNGGGAGNITFQPGLVRSVADNAVVTIIADGAVNNAAGYNGTTTNPRVIGWAKEILVDLFDAANGPQVGQIVTFANDTDEVYTITKLRIIGGGAYGIELDRPLVDAIADDALVHLGPAGKFNFGFVGNAFTFVTRPLPEPRSGVGAISRSVVDQINKITIRVTITYDGNKQGHLVTLDFLMGVGVLNQNSGGVLLG